MSAPFIWAEVNEFSDEAVDKYAQALRMVRRLLIPAVAAENGSDLVCNSNLAPCYSHENSKQNPARSEQEPSLVCKKKDLLVKAALGCVLSRDTECMVPWANGKRDGEGRPLLNLKWEGKGECDIGEGQEEEKNAAQSKAPKAKALQSFTWSRQEGAVPWGCPPVLTWHGNSKGPLFCSLNSKKALFEVNEGSWPS